MLSRAGEWYLELTPVFRTGLEKESLKMSGSKTSWLGFETFLNSKMIKY